LKIDAFDAVAVAAVEEAVCSQFAPAASKGIDTPVNLRFG